MMFMFGWLQMCLTSKTRGFEITLAGIRTANVRRSTYLFSCLINLKNFQSDDHKMLLPQQMFFKKRNFHPYFPKQWEFLSEVRLNTIYDTQIPHTNNTFEEPLSDERPFPFWRTSSWCSSMYLSKNLSSTSNVFVKTQ